MHKNVIFITTLILIIVIIIFLYEKDIRKKNYDIPNNYVIYRGGNVTYPFK